MRRARFLHVENNIKIENYLERKSNHYCNNVIQLWIIFMLLLYRRSLGGSLSLEYFRDKIRIKYK